uniref:Uncharacterized protein n=1 Tax=Oryza glumipatula TaxID=40148 RepID=A0A0D9YQ49_9ORYZ
MANFRVYYGDGEIMSNEMGFDLSNFSQCTLYHPNPDNLRMPEVWYWLTCSFSLDPQVYSVNSVMESFGHGHPMATKSSNPKSIMEGLIARLQMPRIRDGHVGAGLSKEGSTKQFVRPHNEDNIGIDKQSLHIEQAEQTVVAMSSTVQQDGSGEVDEREEINAIVDEIERVDRNAREDEANLAQEDDEEADDEEYEVQPVPTSWNREHLGYIGENELHDSVWFYGDGPINKGAMFSTKSAFQDAVKSWSFKMQRQFKVLKSSPTVYTVVCEMVHGHVPKYESYWLVSRVEEHNCMLRNTRSSHRNLTAAYGEK